MSELLGGTKESNFLSKERSFSYLYSREINVFLHFWTIDCLRPPGVEPPRNPCLLLGKRVLHLDCLQCTIKMLLVYDITGLLTLVHVKPPAKREAFDAYSKKEFDTHRLNVVIKRSYREFEMTD